VRWRVTLERGFPTGAEGSDIEIAQTRDLDAD
jgi:hypothetical protein